GRRAGAGAAVPWSRAGPPAPGSRQRAPRPQRAPGRVSSEILKFYPCNFYCWSIVKKILWFAVAAFIVYYVLHSPQVAGQTIHVAAQSTWHGLKQVAASLTKFLNTLFS